ncbi:hypothetical protein [Labrenzia sp. OB1]|uniref:hypothetical protein n=1 Tax=Labrenzia sp. OB1 TaxID=1561204 RepID=UPI000AC94D9B|nr:hypothetical protein [Labrenzia sp. OB1]
MSDPSRIQVLISKEEADRFEAYCREKGFKKSPLIVRLIREHMNQAGYQTQRVLFKGNEIE